MKPFSSSDAAEPLRPGPIVVALHCSGGQGRQWRPLADALDGRATVLAPGLIGTADVGPWCGQGPFGLQDEAAAILSLIDGCPDPVHLVGHSYGGAVALQAALQRPGRVASLALYEPTTFTLLEGMGLQGRSALSEVRAVARAAEEGLLSGAYAQAAERFVDYWNGLGSWAGLRPQVQADLQRYLPKACLDFRALFNNPLRLEAYHLLSMPILLLQGQHAPAPTALIAQRLHAANKHARRVIVQRAGHMGPLTHAAEVAAGLAAHIEDAALDALNRAA
ncbi:MAG TPA: alpha/beta fold hydrolase [Microvirga sp.]|jgi:pimeloyl-ACP methyl ester carboxylesterase|nr:alpha/beta fold hydrolase [Microvirga sp.]